MTDKDLPRLIVTGGLFLLFGYALYYNVENDMLIGAIMGSFGTAITFWLGSSKGSADKSDQIERTATEAQHEREARDDTPAGTEADPLHTEVGNEPDKPVPTQATRKRP